MFGVIRIIRLMKASLLTLLFSIFFCACAQNSPKVFILRKDEKSGLEIKPY